MRGANISNLGAHTGELLAAAEGRRDHVEHLPRAGRALPGALRREQHRADPALSQRRPAGGDVRHGAADRSRGARSSASTASSCAGAICVTRSGAAVHESVRHGLRQRRLSRRDGEGARARATGQAFRRAAPRREARGKCRGIGVANYVDTATGVPRERAEITVHPDGGVDVVIGTVSNGQGHETSFAQLSPNGSACRSTRCASSPATPTS